MRVSLRTAEEVDLMAVGSVHQRSRVAAYAGLLSPETLEVRTAEAFGEWWTERYRWERETHVLTVADRGGEVVGFTYVGPSETPDAAELYGIHVEPSLVGAGVGRLLMVDAIEKLSQIGGSRAVLWVLDGNTRARRFYEAGGWTADGATRNEPVNGEPVDQLRYSLTFGPALVSLP